jgi:hypothetical protein
MIRLQASLAHALLLWRADGTILPRNSPKVLETKSVPSVTLCTTNPTRTDLATKPGLRGVRPATDRLSHGNPYLVLNLIKTNCSPFANDLPSEHACHPSTIHLHKSVRNINVKPSVDYDTPQTTKRICPWYPQNTNHSPPQSGTTSEDIRVRSQWRRSSEIELTWDSWERQWCKSFRLPFRMCSRRYKH